MSKRNRNKNVNVETEVVEEKVIDMPETTNEEETKEETEVNEKKGFLFKMGEATGKVVGGVVKVATSTPVKVAGGVLLGAGLIAAGYKAGKGELPFGKDEDLETTDVDALDVSDVEAVEPIETPVETTEQET